MTTGPKVIATTGANPDTVVAYHTDYPELQADGDTLDGATAALVQLLTRARDDAEDDLQRDALRVAIRDVQDFSTSA